MPGKAAGAVAQGVAETASKAVDAIAQAPPVKQQLDAVSKAQAEYEAQLAQASRKVLSDPIVSQTLSTTKRVLDDPTTQSVLQQTQQALSSGAKVAAASLTETATALGPALSEDGGLGKLIAAKSKALSESAALEAPRMVESVKGSARAYADSSAKAAAGVAVQAAAMAQVEAKHMRLPWPVTLSFWLR